MARKKIEIYDTTLRDGNQGEGVNLSLADKLDITLELDAMGIDFIEGGWPGSNPKDIEYFQQVRSLELKHSQVVAFGSTHRADAEPANDFFLQNLVESAADITCIFGKTWDLHVEQFRSFREPRTHGRRRRFAVPIDTVSTRSSGPAAGP